jgi:hypothetical protein
MSICASSLATRIHHQNSEGFKQRNEILTHGPHSACIARIALQLQRGARVIPVAFRQWPLISGILALADLADQGLAVAFRHQSFRLDLLAGTLDAGLERGKLLGSSVEASDFTI